MKTVFDNRMCAHVWAQRTQTEGRSDNMHFEGDVIYSYRTPIAAFTPEGAALVSSEGYSPTTRSKHLPAVHRAIRGLSFTVPDIGHGGGRAHTVYSTATGRKGWESVHRRNLEWLVEQYHKEVARQMRKTQWHADDAGSVAECLDGDYGPARVARAYARAFGLPVPDLPVTADAARIWERRERLNNDPKRKARAAEKAAREARAEELRRADTSVKLEAWRKGEYEFQFNYRCDDDSAALRVKGDNVETSLGATVPLADARHIFRHLETVRRNGQQSWVRPEGLTLGYNLGHFTLDSFDEKGIRAGCHFISWAEIERIAPQLRQES